MYNKVILMGRIVNDLELKALPSGASVLSFRIAVDRNYQPKDGERQTDFISVVAWRSVAEFISKYFEKGRMILIDGELQTRSYTNKDGIDVTITEVVATSAHFTGEKKSEGSAPNHAAQKTVETTAKKNAEPETVKTDDYPF